MRYAVTMIRMVPPVPLPRLFLDRSATLSRACSKMREARLSTKDLRELGRLEDAITV